MLVNKTIDEKIHKQDGGMFLSFCPRDDTLIFVRHSMVAQ